MGHVIEVEDKPMPTNERCTRCGAQAWVDVALPGDGGSLLFCAHHYAANEDALAKIPGVKVADHRPFLLKQEAALAAR